MEAKELCHGNDTVTPFLHSIRNVSVILQFNSKKYRTLNEYTNAKLLISRWNMAYNCHHYLPFPKQSIEPFTEPTITSTHNNTSIHPIRHPNLTSPEICTMILCTRKFLLSFYLNLGNNLFLPFNQTSTLFVTNKKTRQITPLVNRNAMHVIDIQPQFSK